MSWFLRFCPPLSSVTDFFFSFLSEHCYYYRNMSWCGRISSLYGYQRESHTCEGRYGKCFVILVHSRFMLGTKLECASNMRLARLRASDPVHSRHDRCNCEIRSEQSNGDPDCHCQKERRKKSTKNSEELAQKVTYLGPYGDLSSASW